MDDTNIHLQADAVEFGSEEYSENDEDKLDWKSAKRDQSSQEDDDDDSETPDSQSVGYSEQDSEPNEGWQDSETEDSQSPEAMSGKITLLLLLLLQMCVRVLKI